MQPYGTRLALLQRHLTAWDVTDFIEGELEGLSLSGRGNPQWRCGISPFVTASGQPSAGRLDPRRADEQESLPQNLGMELSRSRGRADRRSENGQKRTPSALQAT